MKKTKDILIIIFAILVISSIIFVIVGIFVIQDKYEGEPVSTELIPEKLTESISLLQENKIDKIKNRVKTIKSDSTLIENEFDWVKLTGITTDGGGILKVWQNEKQINKIAEEIGLSYGRIGTTIYLDNGIPIKIIETEENFGFKDGEVNYNELKEVFRAITYVFDWENDESKIERIGKRNMSEGSCSNFDYEPIIERAKKAASE